MKNKLFQNYILPFLLFIFISLSIFVSYTILYNPFFESFSNNTTIILLGDSILNNANFVPSGKSIFDILKSKNTNTINYSTNEANITDTIYQINSIQTDLSNDNINIFISAGGNNILQSTNTGQKPDITNLFSQLVKVIQTVKARLPNAKIFLLNLYLPPTPKFIIFKDYITDWNNLLQTNKNNYNYKIVDIYTLLNNTQDFINDYEPSVTGGNKIANAIYLAS